MRLSEVGAGKQCVVIKVLGHGGFRKRLIEMGFIKNQLVKVVKNAPFQDPIEYSILGTHISLRKSSADQVEVMEVDAVEIESQSTNYLGTITSECRERIEQSQKTINVALIGNPNAGKTSFFNYATGKDERVGNYSGVTVSAKTAILKKNGYTINFIDLPGSYSLSNYTPEEKYVTDFLVDETPDIVLNIVDASNLERNLFLTTQLIDMNLNVIIALNMVDEMKKTGSEIDSKHLGEMLGIPFVETNASKGIGIQNVVDSIIELYVGRLDRRHIHINYGNTIEDAIEEIKRDISSVKSLYDKYHLRYLALRLLEGDEIKDIEPSTVDIVTKNIKNISAEYRDDLDSIISNARYGFIKGALRQTFKEGPKNLYQISDGIDKILTNKWLGIPALLLFLFIMFQSTFTLGSYPQGWIESFIGWIGSIVQNSMPDGVLKDLVVDGIIAGVGGVIVFLPNIIILFLFIAFMEDTGYMARATFIMDKLMHRMGLHGRSFISLLSGFGCSVPAIMTIRTLESRKDRVLTMLAIPFMSCTAKLPVYILFVSVFFPNNQGAILLLIYLIGMIVAILSSMLLKRTVFRDDSHDFVMELPPYRVPTSRNVVKHMWRKTIQYLKKMGGVILIASIAIWALSTFPKDEAKDSYIETIGKTISPAMEPLGMDWKMSVSLMTGFVAKETVVSTMGVLYDTDEDEGLKAALKNEGYTRLGVFAFLLFVLLYAPCFPSIIVAAKETSNAWAAFMVVYTIGVAWLISFLVYNIGLLF